VIATAGVVFQDNPIRRRATNGCDLPLPQSNHIAPGCVIPGQQECNVTSLIRVCYRVVRHCRFKTNITEENNSESVSLPDCLPQQVICVMLTIY
jgi:hypothetical protein